MSYTEPLLAVFCVLSFIGLIRLRQRKGSLLAGLGLLGLFVLSWPPFDWLLSRPLEIWYPIRPFQISIHSQAIVVLGSAVERPVYERPYALPDHETYQRCEFAARLYSRWQPLPVLACGGRGGKDQEPYSKTMRLLLERAGVSPNMIWTEERSRSTHENAVFGAQILHQHGIRSVVLVVDASSMPRAAASFRKAGIDVVPAPSAFRELGSFADEIFPSWRAVRQNEITLHETVGLAWYWLHGWI